MGRSGSQRRPATISAGSQPPASLLSFRSSLPRVNPFAITAGPDGALWFTESGGSKIGRITTAGIVTEFQIPTSGSQSTGITAGSDGALWFTEEFGNKIGRVTTAGVFSEFNVPTGDASPLSITAGPDSALWFTEEFGNRIGRITTAGIITEYQVPTAESEPNGITTGPDGALWFTETIGNNLGRITTAGSLTEYPIPTPSAEPFGIASGPDGALWFAENGLSQIGRAGIVAERAQKTYSITIVAPAITITGACPLPQGTRTFSIPSTRSRSRAATGSTSSLLAGPLGSRSRLPPVQRRGAFSPPPSAALPRLRVRILSRFRCRIQLAPSLLRLPVRSPSILRCW